MASNPKARSAFSGTYSTMPRPVVTMAPDALVYFNGESEVMGCPGCNRKFDFHKYITSIQVDLNIDSSPGSASISLVVPRHSLDDVYYEGQPVITPMMEVEIYAKGYYLVGGVPQYYPIFWGVVTEVTDQYSGGQHTVSINCSDILKWWEVTKINVNPALTQAQSSANGWQLFGNVFHGTNPYDVIWTLAQQTMGDVVLGSGSLFAYYGDKTQKSTINMALGDIMLYWKARFERVRNNLLLYGPQGIAVRGTELAAKYKTASDKYKGTPFASALVRDANGGKDGGSMIFDTTSSSVVAYKTVMADAGQIDLWNSEFRTKLEIANEAKDVIGYEFFMDVSGDIVFKPPFYNVDVLSNKPLSWIQDIDIIDWDFSESEAEVFTQVQLSGHRNGPLDLGFTQNIEPVTTVTDYHLLRRYGWRPHQLTSEFMSSPKLMYFYGLDLLDRLNSRRHRGSVSIPLRPELRLGFPVYVAPKDQIWYLTGISHNIQFGGTAQTTLTLTSKRAKFFAPRGIGKLSFEKWNGTPPKAGSASQGAFQYSQRQISQGMVFKVELGDAASIPTEDPKVFEKPAAENPYAPLIYRHPKTNRPCGFPNVVLVYTRPFVLSDPAKLTSKKAREVLKQQTATAQENAKAQAQDLADALSVDRQDNPVAVRVKYMQNRYQYGVTTSGAFTYLHDEGEKVSRRPIISEAVLMPGTSLVVDPTNLPAGADKYTKLTQAKNTVIIRPVSDARGFEVIGHFRYGRGLYLRDGIIQQSGDTNTPSAVTYQIPLTSEALNSVGLSNLVRAGEADPAQLLSRLVPEEDLQITHESYMRTTPTSVTTTTPARDPADVNARSSTLEQTTANSFAESVETTQLSKALTLAELTIKNYTESTTCSCLLERSDLADYQDKTIITDTAENFARTFDKFLFDLFKQADDRHQLVETDLRGKVEKPPTELRVGQTPGGSPGPYTPPFPGASNFMVMSPPFNNPALYSTRSWDEIVRLYESSLTGFQEAYGEMTDSFMRGIVLQYYQAKTRDLDEELGRLRAELARMETSQNTGLLATEYGAVGSESFRLAMENLKARIAALEAQRNTYQQNSQAVAAGGTIPDQDKAAATQEYGTGAVGATKTYG